MKKIVIVDYGLGNIFSIKQALVAVSADPIVSSKVEDLKNADGILLPGVGAFADAMNKLKQLNLVSALKQEVATGKPLLGVCLGLQLLFESSSEFGSTEGLGLIPGEVKKFPESFDGKTLNVPFIGWNSVKVNEEHKKNLLFSENDMNSKMYFVHSFYVVPKNEKCTLATCQYQGFVYPTIVQYKNVSGVQGHPEKSGLDGLHFYRNWIQSL